jgi:Pentapeptide repeats (8 copies)
MLSGSGSQPPPAPSPAAALQAGEYVCGVKLVSVVFEGGGLRMWSAVRRDGRQAVVWLMLLDVPELREHFCAAAREMKDKARQLEGVLQIAAVDPELGAYSGDIEIRTTLADMDYIDFSRDEALGLATKLGHILTSLHDNGIIHGCLRPECVLIDDDNQPIVCNAKAFDVGELCRTDPAAVVLFQQYSPPEQRFGGASTPQTDVFSLGRILHLALMHKEPAEKDEALPRLDVMDDLPNGIRRMVRGCVAGDLDKRYGRPMELVEDIPRFRLHEPVGCPHPAFDRAAALEKVQEARALAIKEGRVQKGPEAVMVQQETVEGMSPGKRIGLVMLAVALVVMPTLIAFFTSSDHIGFSITTFLCVLPLGVAMPGFGQPKILGKVMVAVLVLGALVFGDPARRGAEAEGKTAGLRDHDVAMRVATFKELVASGEKELRSVDLAGADLAALDLSGVALDGGSLKGANCSGVNLDGGSIQNVDLEGTNFGGANLAGLIPNVAKNWGQALCDDTTTMPEGWACKDEHPQLTVEK